MKQKSPLLSLVLALTFLVTGSLLRAQTGTGTISGLVTDPSAAAVPTATVTVTNVGTQVDRVVQTNDVGIYSVPLLPPGDYKVSAKKDGFKPFVRSGIVLLVDQNSRQDIALVVGAAVEAVEVHATAEQFLKPATSELGEVITSDPIQQLPLNGRSVFALIALNAGVSSTTASFFKGVGVDLSLNGQRSGTNSFLIDGADNISWMAQSPNNSLQVDAVGEFNIITNNYSAEYGRANAGIINVAMRSGTNQLHGSLFEFLRNDKLDATDFFSNKVGADKLPFRFNQFGGTLGGPIRKDKTFFFVAYQGTISHTSYTSIQSVPLVPWRTGDFSSLLNSGVQIYDPTNVIGHLPPPDDVVPIRAAFPNNIIPPEKQDPTAQKLLAFYPVPNLPGTFNNLALPLTNTSDFHEVDVKIDHHFNESNTVSGRYNFGDASNRNQPPFGDDGGGGNVPIQDTRSQNLGLSYTHIFRPTILNDFRFTYLRSAGNLLPSGFGKDLNTQVGIPGINVDNNTSGLAFIIPLGFSAFGGQVFFPQITGITTYQFLDNLTVTHGRHSVRTGVDYHKNLLHLFQTGFPRGLYIYDALATAQVGAGGNAIASMLMSDPTFAERDILNHFIEQRGWELGAFIQDDYRVTSRLTLNLGLRYDFFSPNTEEQNRQGNFSLATNTILLAGQDGNSRTLVNSNKKDFAPRFGFAYSLTGDQRTVLRGGYGISFFAEQNALATLDRLTYNIPFYFLFSRSQATFLDPVFTTQNMILTPPAVDPNVPFGKVESRDPNLKDGYVQSWNLDLQRELSPSTVLDVAYAGSKGTHLLGVRNPNQPPPGAVRVFPISPLIGLLFTLESRVNSIYNALQIKVNRRLASGLTFLGSYTWGRSIDNSVGYWPNSGISQLPQDSANYGRVERGLSDWDIHHRMVFSFDWRLPFGQGRKFLGSASGVTNAILGGWQMTGIFNLQTGTPFTAIIATNQANTANGGALRPNALADGNLPRSERSVDRWFDKSAFALPALFTYGNGGRNTLIGPGFNNLDWGLYKNFKLNERWQLQFRSEFYNLTNTPHFALPNQTVDQPAGGTITGLSGAPRQIQFALKLLF